MRFTNAILLVAGAARLIASAPSEVTTFTFPEGSGIQGTVIVNQTSVNNQIKNLAAAAKEAGFADDPAFSDTITSLAEVGFADSSVFSDPTNSLAKAGGKKDKQWCENCLANCIPICLLPFACIGCLVYCAANGCYPS